MVRGNLSYSEKSGESSFPMFKKEDNSHDHFVAKSITAKMAGGGKLAFGRDIDVTDEMCFFMFRNFSLQLTELCPFEYLMLCPCNTVQFA